MICDNFDELLDEINYAYEKVPFYKRHVDKAGVELEYIGDVDDLNLLPTTEKRDYRKNFPVGTFAKGYSLRDSSLVRSQSSGTTGDRLITYEVGMLLTSRAMDCVEINPMIEEVFSKENRRVCRYAPPNCSDVECANPNRSMLDRILEDGTLVLPVYHDLLTTNEILIKRALEEIIEYKPDFYYVDPTHFAFLLRHAEKLNITIPLAPIVATYSAITPLCRAQIVDYFTTRGHTKVHLAQLVSCSEMGWIALECEEGHLHLNTEAFYMELVNDEKHVKVGGTGELLISSIDNGAVPHIRYKTGDIFTLVAKECACGHESPIVKIEGRKSSFVLGVEGKKYSVHDIGLSIGTPYWLDMFQFCQHQEQNYSLQLIVNEKHEAGFENEIYDRIHKLLGENITIEITLVPYISTERSGKFSVLKIINE